MVSAPLGLACNLPSLTGVSFEGPLQLVFPIREVVHANLFAYVLSVLPFLRSICTCMISSTMRAFRR